MIRMTYREAYDEGRKLIVSDEAGTECAVLLEYVMNTDRNALFTHPERVLSEEEKALFFELVKRRNTGEPVQYITGKTYFFGLEFYCDPSVLIPRFDTEVLVETVLERCKGKQNLRILDLCTGSGCIALALQKHLPAMIQTSSKT